MNRIEELRKKKSLSQKELCKRLGISVKTYYNYVNGFNIPSEILIQLSNIFQCSIDWLLGVSDYNSITVINSNRQPIAVIGKTEVIEHSGYKVIFSNN